MPPGDSLSAAALADNVAFMGLCRCQQLHFLALVWAEARSERSHAGLLPYPLLSANTTQRLTYVKFFLNALNGDVSAATQSRE